MPDIRLLVAAALFALFLPAPAEAIPYFAHEYGMACVKCHSVVPRLNAFGNAFMDHGYQLPGAQKNGVFPLSTKFNFVYDSEPDPDGLPKAIVDEVEVFLAGSAGPRTNYFIEQYLVDGGTPGATRDAWIAERLTPDTAKVPVYVQGGSFTLPLPIDPETFRESNQHYTVWDQTVGDNPFNFFDPKIGVMARAGFADHGTSVRVLALQGHDKQSGIPSLGTDTMAFAQTYAGPVALSAYRYDGSRPDGLFADRFYRQGVGLVYAGGKWESDTVMQFGHDTSFDGTGSPAISSGGFTQLRYQFDRRIFGQVRYEGTNDPVAGLSRDIVPMIGYRTSRNSRFTLEDVLHHDPNTRNELGIQYTVAY